jgi:pyruvate-formate lyase
MSSPQITTEPPRPEILSALGEHMAAGLFEEPTASWFARWSRAVRRRLENRPAPAYEGGLLYPAGPIVHGQAQNRIVSPSYSFTWAYNDRALQDRLSVEEAPEHREALQALGKAMTALNASATVGGTPHTVGGWGYTHSIPNFGRVLREGLDAYADRVKGHLAASRQRQDRPRVEFYEGLLDVLAGIGAWHGTLVAYLESWQPPDAESAGHREALLGALRRVPFAPAGSFFEAIVAYNLVYYLDDCDNPGRMDQELQPLYAEDLAAETITFDAACALIGAFADNVCANGGWSAAIGGTTPDGSAGYNDVTRMMLCAAHGRYRPNLELRVRPDMPDDLWEEALDAVGSGSGNPAFYNEPGYLQSLRDADLGVSEEDLAWWNGGGCTETMIHGRSNVGSLEAGLHVPLILERSLRARLAGARSFEALMAGFCDDVSEEIARLVQIVNRHQQARAKFRPQPMRTLLVDDCIDRGIDFNAGGARYNWSVVNIAGLTNVADSLAAVREVVFEARELSGADLLAALAADFEEQEPLRQRLLACPKFGNDDRTVDGLAAQVAEFVFAQFRQYTTWRGGRFLPSVIMFVTYGDAGRPVGATPDGRHAYEPLADSIGPINGRDTHGPTAMLNSVARLPLHLATGTPVLNMRLSRSLFSSSGARRCLRDLIEAFFRNGGMQLQLSAVNRRELEDALVHPEEHRDLIVRVGGYSAHFNSLPDDVKRCIIARTEYDMGG